MKTKKILVLCALVLNFSNLSFAADDSIPENAHRGRNQGGFELGTLVASPSKVTFFTLGGKGVRLFQNNLYIGGGGHGGFGVGGGSKSAGIGYGGFIAGYLYPATEKFQISPEVLLGGGGMGGIYKNGGGVFGGGSLVILPRVYGMFRLCQGVFLGAEAGYLIAPMLSKMSGVTLGLNLSFRSSFVTWLVD